jgi:hypothetical protein
LPLHHYPLSKETQVEIKQEPSNQA